MPITVACTHCAQTLQVLDEHAGKQVRCPKCYQVFVAAAPLGAAPAPAPPQPVVVAKFCPHCGAALAGGAFCPNCGKSPGQPPQAAVPAPYAQGPRTNTLAVVSLVLGLMIFGCWPASPLFSLAGVICGHMALTRIRESDGAQTGRGLAIAGLVVNYVILVGAACVISAMILSRP